MSNTNKGKWLLGLIFAVILLGIGYAIVTNIVLNINGTASTRQWATDADFKVKFVEVSDYDDSGYASVNAVAAAGLNVTKSTTGSAELNAIVNSGGNTATFSASDMVAGEVATFTYYIANLSNGLNANIRVPEITGSDVDNETYFTVGVTPVTAFTLGVGEVQAVVVTVACNSQLPLESVNSGTYTITFTAAAAA